MGAKARDGARRGLVAQLYQRISPMRQCRLDIQVHTTNIDFYPMSHSAHVAPKGMSIY